MFISNTPKVANIQSLKLRAKLLYNHGVGLQSTLRVLWLLGPANAITEVCVHLTMTPDCEAVLLWCRGCMHCLQAAWRCTCVETIPCRGCQGQLHSSLSFCELAGACMLPCQTAMLDCFDTMLHAVACCALALLIADLLPFPGEDISSKEVWPSA